MNEIRNLSLLIFVLVSADNLIWAWGPGTGWDCSWQGHTESVPMISQLPRWGDGYTIRLERKRLFEDSSCMPAKSLQSCPTLCTLWTATRQAPLFMGLSRQEYWSGLPCPPPGDLIFSYLSQRNIRVTALPLDICWINLMGSVTEKHLHIIGSA